MVNKLIWCIENRYADTIVQARNWYLQQEQNAAMMNQLNGVAKKLGDIEKIQKEAAAEAAMAHQQFSEQSTIRQAQLISKHPI